MHIHDKTRHAFSSAQWLGVDFRNRLIREDILLETDVEVLSVSDRTVRRLKNKVNR